MFERLSRSWALVKASAAVLQADKELVLFPAISGLMLLLTTAGFAVPIVLTATNQNEAASSPASALNFVVGFLFYLVSYFVMFFFNSALVGAALIRLRGGDPTVSDGFRLAFAKVGTIFGYALVAATVGMILRTLQERAGFVGRIIIGLFGMAWTVATFLVVPVMMSEELGPIESVKRSTSLLKSTWGEQLAGNFGIGAVTSWAGFVLVIIMVPLIVVAGASGSTPLLIAAIAGGVVMLLALSLISSTLSGIYTAAVYRYAADGEIGQGFDVDMIQGAFRSK